MYMGCLRAALFLQGRSLRERNVPEEAGRGALARRAALVGLCLAVGITGWISPFARTAARVRRDTLRLHVRAAGDSWQDLQVKYRVRDAILDEAARIVRDGPDEALFERLKKSEFGRRLRELDGFEGVCCAMADAYFRGEEYYDFPELYDELTAADAVEFMRGCMTPERMTLSVILPRQSEGEEDAECSQP